MEYSSDSEHGDMTVVAGNDVYKPEEDDQQVALNETELNDLMRDLNLSKESAQLLISQIETSDSVWNNVLLVSRSWERIKTVFHIPW